VTNNAPYEPAFAAGCDAMVIVSQKGESEGERFATSLANRVRRPVA
jgi:hypothetical protein